MSLYDGDVTQFVHNPALLDTIQTGAVAFTYSPYFVDIHSLSSVYAGNFGKAGKLAIGVSYLDFGDFEGRMNNGDPDADFSANDLVFVVGKSHRISSFILGTNLKFAINDIAGYGSSMLLADIGGIYRAPNADFTVGMVFKNMGFLVSDYTGTNSGEVPFDVQISSTFKPRHMPFRFSLSAFNLNRDNLYFDSNEDELSSKNVEIANKIFRKINIGTELVLHESMQILFGYSHLLRQELKVGDVAYGAGISFGFSLRIKQFRLQYSHSKYHAAGGTNFFTLQTNINSFKKII